jgi:hypothetical protein
MHCASAAEKLMNQYWAGGRQWPLPPPPPPPHQVAALWELREEEITAFARSPARSLSGYITITIIGPKWMIN